LIYELARSERLCSKDWANEYRHDKELVRELRGLEGSQVG